MQINSITFRQFNTSYKNQDKNFEIEKMISQFSKTFELPNETRNYSNFDEKLVKNIVANKEKAINPIAKMLDKAETEKDKTAGLFLLNRLIDEGTNGIETIYPILSKFNYSSSPNVQTMLAGIYRKTQIPDGFGPLMTMFWKNSQNPITSPFDPNEEIGGAILEYLRNQTAVKTYSKN